jgi:UDP:flavonoid glycosyltransferase YjiC (YdhE family)
MRFLFTTIPGSGHFHPMVPLAQTLRQRGHEVVFAASPAFTASVEAAGFDNIPTGPSWLENLGDPVMAKIVQGELVVELTRMGMVEGVVRAAGAFRPDAIVRGGAEIGGLIASAILDIPMASHVAAADKRYLDWIRPSVSRAADAHGLDGERVSGRDFAVLQIDRTPASFQPPGWVASGSAINIRPEVYDGGGELPEWFEGLAHRPLVYVTFGTVFNLNTDLFVLVARALSAEPIDVVMTVGRGASIAALGPLPGNVHAVPYLSQARVLKSAAAVVCHGGYNTVIAALGAGVPIYAIPMGADQPFNAERLVATGAGLSAPPPVPTGRPGPPAFTPPAPDDIRDATRRLVAEQSFRAGALRIASEIDALPGADVAAQRLEAAVQVSGGVPA